MKNEATRLSVTATALLPGPLFEEISEEGDLFHFYYVALEVEVTDGRRFVHFHQVAGFSARSEMEAFEAKVKARGEIVVENGWTETEEGPSLEERLGAYGIEWQLEARERHAVTGSFLPA